jgi:membrane protease YdiL (CAAX protease family)
MLNVFSKQPKAKGKNTSDAVRPVPKEIAQKSSKKYHWTPLAAMAWVLLGFAVLPVVASVVITLIPSLLGWDQVRADEWVLSSPLANFLFVLLSEVLTVAALTWFISHRKASFKQVMALRRPRLNDVGRAIAGIIVYFVLFAVSIMVVEQMFPINTEQEQALGFARDVSGGGLILAFISLVILPPLAEELIFRGFFYGTLRGYRLSVAWSIFITSALFAALHLFGSADGKLLWIAFLDTFVLSLVLCYLREKTGAIWSSILVHALKNGFVFLNIFIINAR